MVLLSIKSIAVEHNIGKECNDSGLKHLYGKGKNHDCKKSEYRAAHPVCVAKETQRNTVKRQLIRIKDSKADLKALGKAMKRKLSKRPFKDCRSK